MIIKEQQQQNEQIFQECLYKSSLNTDPLPLGKIPRNEFLSYVVNVVLTLWETDKFPQSGYSIFRFRHHGGEVPGITHLPDTSSASQPQNAMQCHLLNPHFSSDSQWHLFVHSLSIVKPDSGTRLFGSFRLFITEPWTIFVFLNQVFSSRFPLVGAAYSFSQQLF